MTDLLHRSDPDHVIVSNPQGSSCVVVVCEHAHNFIPAEFHDLGLSGADRQSHAAWDPGAMAVAQGLSRRLDATLVASGVSRLVYDCNRPPSAPDAMPAQSETISVPGNADLSAQQRADRAACYYEPFRERLATVIQSKPAPVIVTVHSFTPIYHGRARAVEIGILHDSDARLADAMLQTARAHTDANVQRNDPYGPADGVTHTLREHALRHGHLNVMIEIRNDLIATDSHQQEMAQRIAKWLAEACAQIGADGVQPCQG